MTRRLTPAICGMIFVAAVVVLTNSACPQIEPGEQGQVRQPRTDQAAVARLQSRPRGLPPVSVPEDNPLTVEKIALGRKLFFDRRLSSNNTISCGLCHIPEQGFTNNELSTPIGVAGRSLKRNAPTILNVAYAEQLFLDGRETSLERQAVVPLLAHDEMANPSAGALIARIADLPDYQGLFEEAFGGGPSMERIGKAIASWERTLLAGDSPFDRWRYAGEFDALTPEQQRGFRLFVGRGRCDKCHLVGRETTLFTDQEFHDTGIGYLRDRNTSQKSGVRVEIAPGEVVAVERQIVQQVEQVRSSDLGRFEVTQDSRDMWRFRTPGLRNVAVTAPYMHDGSLPTLRAVVSYYNRGGVAHHGLDPLIKPLGLDDSELHSLVAFLLSLTSDNLAALVEDARSVAVGN